jgi:hypothetical protein
MAQDTGGKERQFQTMPIGEIAGELLGGAVRFLGSIVVELVLEVAIRGPGYFICRLFDEDVDPESSWVILAGVIFWILIGIVSYFSYL